MEELHHHLQQLRGDLQAEIAAYVGDWSGMNYIEIADKHIHAANHLISSKRAHLQPGYIELANTPKENIRVAPGNDGLADLVAEARYFLDSILGLENFKRSIEDLFAVLLELDRQHAERLAWKPEPKKPRAQEPRRKRRLADSRKNRLRSSEP